MKVALKILLTLALLLGGLILLGKPQWSPHRDIFAIFGILCLLSAWALWTLGSWSKKTDLVGLIKSELDHRLKQLEKEVKQSPTPEAYLKLAEQYLRLNKAKKVIELLNAHGDEIPDELKTAYLLMKAYFLLRDYAKAWEAIEKIYSKDPAYDDHNIKLWAAQCYLELLEPENALNFVNQFIEHSGATAEALMVKGVALSRLGKSEDAQRCLVELEESKKDVPAVRASQINFLIKALKKELDKPRKKT